MRKRTSPRADAKRKDAVGILDSKYVKQPAAPSSIKRKRSVADRLSLCSCLQMVDKDGTLALNNPRKRNAADMLAGTPYIPTGSPAAAAASSQRRAAAAASSSSSPEQPSVATVNGNVTSYSNISPDDDGNMNSCIICGDIGTLICCDLWSAIAQEQTKRCAASREATVRSVAANLVRMALSFCSADVFQ